MMLNCNMGGQIGIRRLRKKFVDLDNKIKSTDAISLKLLYACNQYKLMWEVSECLTVNWSV